MKLKNDKNKIGKNIKKVHHKYNRLVKMLTSSYYAINDVLIEITIPKEQLILELDDYVQNVLLKIALSDHELSLNEIDLVKKIVIKKPNDILTMLSLGISNNSLQEAEHRLNNLNNKIPEFIKIFASADKEMIKLNRHPKNYSKKIFTALIDLMNAMMQADGIIYSSEILKTKDVLKSIITFYNEEGLC